MEARHTILLVIFTFLSPIANAQYEFTDEHRVDCTEIKSQQKTGTCWCFSSISFLESELMRTGKGTLDLSEAYIVRKIYEDKARNYIMRHGKANFSQGSLSHDVLRAAKMYGLMPQKDYPGLTRGDTALNHSELARGLKAYLDAVIENKKPSRQWEDAVQGILDAYLGAVPERFEVEGKTYDPISYAEYLGIRSEDYVSITSYTHHPFGTYFVLEIPDNYSNGYFYNISIDQLVETTEYAVKKGYSLVWDGDVSEKGFDQKKGMAILPTDEKRDSLFSIPGEEIAVSQNSRQENFYNYQSKDDHLMHVMGTAKDQEGTKYFLIKNSWGKKGPHKGFLYMSESYFRDKTVSVLLNKEALPKNIDLPGS